MALIPGLALIAFSLVACGGGNSASGSISETFIALELESSDGVLSVENKALYSIEGGEIVPTFRFGSNTFPIFISPEFGAPRAQNYRMGK